jgi:transposase
METHDLNNIQPPPEHVLASLPESVRIYLQQLTFLTQQLMTRVRELEAQLSKNSSNSSKPPSSDGLKKPPRTTSQRGKSGKKPGGQPGHEGKTLEPVDVPDRVIVHSPGACAGCGHCLEQTAGACVEKRQVFDLPEPKVEVTEHRVEAKICPCCGGVSKGVFPENVAAPTQYGERVQALAVYFAHQHFLPFDRLTQIFEYRFPQRLVPT